MQEPLPEISYLKSPEDLKDILAEEMKYDERDRKDIVVHFTAPWSKLCEDMAGDLQKLADEVHSRVTIYKVDVEATPAMFEGYGEPSESTLPLFVAYRDEKLVEKMTQPSFADVEAMVLDLSGLQPEPKAAVGEPDAKYEEKLEENPETVVQPEEAA